MGLILSSEGRQYQKGHFAHINLIPKNGARTCQFDIVVRGTTISNGESAPCDPISNSWLDIDSATWDTPLRYQTRPTGPISGRQTAFGQISWVFAGFCFCASPPRSTRCLRLCALRGSTRRLRLGVTRAACALVHTFVKTSIIHAAPRFASPKAGVTCAAGVLVHTFVKTLIIHAALCFASPKVGVTRAAGVLVHTFVKTLIIHAAPRFASPTVGVTHAACMLVHTFVKTLIIHAAPCCAGSHTVLGWGSHALPARWFIHLSRL